ncbi:helix-turn-helix domain-containing protein [Candidatus Pacearchaeota archaeon]|nr:helix-turn-helix domain-containing protein [Candidatus Pacearchaeota archaeon]MBD3283130.1 helix-turn-helix domain-containing protein [Candidatus Pacearchaeota archaeon]
MKDEDKKMEDDKKFILMGIDDADDVADVLRSKTAKKILDFLAEVKEASENDIARGLDIPINTVEYNLKKLIKSGFVKKAKNFFWSVKGKKIEMYKLANKHIVISPNKKPNINYLKSIISVMVILAIAIIGLLLYMFPEEGKVFDLGETEGEELLRFHSQGELEEFLEENSEVSQEYFRAEVRAESARNGFARDGAPATTKAGEAGVTADDYSTTNIQVEGVDEADIVKNDGRYIYVVSGNKVVIVDAYPPENMKIIKEINFSERVSNIYINNDKLIVFSWGSYPVLYEGGVEARCIGCNPKSGYKSTVYIYDISDKKNPELENEIAYDGNYVNSRMIGDYVYLISNKYVNINNPTPPVYWRDGNKISVEPSDVYYWPYPDTSYVFTSITAIDVDDGDFTNKVYLTGSTNNIYVSQDNIYVTYQKRIGYENYAERYADEVAYPILPGYKDDEVREILEEENSDRYYYRKLNAIKKVIYDYSLSLKGEKKGDFDEELLELEKKFQLNIQKEMEKTVVHKIHIDNEDIEYKSVGEAPGRVLNQFSMDEYDGYFRIATTTGNWRDISMNHVYVLDKDLEIVGKVEDLAEGERIYSVRFMRGRAYMVTFRQVDPLFVIDLSDPDDPDVLGYLKVTGYSSYLHPYDENHIIGIGKEATEQGRVQGIKIALFDVSDVKHPEQVSKYEIGEDWAYRSYQSSQALHDHKAFLFDRSRELLVIPVSYTRYLSKDYRDNEYWQGSYVFTINLNGIKLRGRVTHSEGSESRYSAYVRRSLYMDNFLYTISNFKVKANSLISLDEISEVKLSEKESY